MDENRIVELLTRKIAGEATSEELGELSYLLAKYPEAIYYEALLEQVWELGENDEKASVEDTYENHKLKFKEELNFESEGSLLLNFLKKPVVFLSAFILFMISAYFFNSNRHVSKEDRIEIVAGKGIRKEIKLPDGTFIRLNSDSKISYYTNMEEREQRLVNLSGEAFFNVSHQRGRPFVVRTNKVAIKVLGTEFNVKEYPGELRSETTLLKGSIELTINGRSEQKFLLKPSEKFALVEKKAKLADEEGSSLLMIENVSPLKLGNKEYIGETSWVENKLVFQNESFEDMMPKLERWYNVKIILDDPAIRSYRFTGVFINENIIEALEAMQLIKSFNYKLTENEVKIY